MKIYEKKNQVQPFCVIWLKMIFLFLHIFVYYVFEIL